MNDWTRDTLVDEKNGPRPSEARAHRLDFSLPRCRAARCTGSYNALRSRTLRSRLARNAPVQNQGFHGHVPRHKLRQRFDSDRPRGTVGRPTSLSPWPDPWSRPTVPIGVRDAVDPSRGPAETRQLWTEYPMKTTRRALLQFGALSLATPAAAPAKASTPAVTETEALVTALDAVVEQSDPPGVAISIFSDVQPLIRRDYGLGNLETRTGVGPESVFRIGSLTKQFAAAAVVKLASEGRVSLDDPVDRYLGAFAGLEPVTLRELMTHTAGLIESDAEACLVNAAGTRSARQLAEQIAALPPPYAFPPGTAWLYSNANYIVLGAVIEQVTGQSLAQAMTDIVFAPLGLASLAFDTITEVVPGRVSGYATRDDGRGFVQASPIDIAEAGAAGAMRGTAADLCAWHHALLSNRLFGPQWVEAMLTPGRLRDGRVSGANRFSADDANYGEVQYSLGLLISPPAPEGSVITHYGYISGFSACLETFVDRNITFAVLCNGEVGPGLPFRGVRRAIRAALIDQA